MNRFTIQPDNENRPPRWSCVFAVIAAAAVLGAVWALAHRQ